MAPGAGKERVCIVFRNQSVCVAHRYTLCCVIPCIFPETPSKRASWQSLTAAGAGLGRPPSAHLSGIAVGLYSFLLVEYRNFCAEVMHPQ